MKKKLLFFSIGLVTLGGNVFGQQDMNVTHFIFNKMNFNPGATGVNGPGICATGIYRNQWDKVNGAPNSFILNVEGNFDDRGFLIPGRFGLAVYHDEIGFTRQSNAALNYSYAFGLNPGELSVGIGLGMQSIGMDPDWVPPTTIIDPSLPTGFGATNFDMNFGVYFKGNQDYYAGLSSTHLTAPGFKADGSMVAGSNTQIVYNAARHYYIMGGKKFRNIAGGDIEGNVLLKTDMVKMSADINARYIWNDAAYGGVTYRTSDAAALMLGADILKVLNNVTGPDRFIVGYSYDFTINKLSSISKGSHEILLKYCYYLPPIPVQKWKHPRWL